MIKNHTLVQLQRVSILWCYTDQLLPQGPSLFAQLSCLFKLTLLGLDHGLQEQSPCNSILVPENSRVNALSLSK